MFTASRNKGFTMKFNNGFSISVQWGTSNYCSVKDLGKDLQYESKQNRWESITAEIAVFDNNGGFVAIGNNDVVIGWVSADTVAKCITIVQSATTKEEIETKIRALMIVKTVTIKR